MAVLNNDDLLQTLKTIDACETAESATETFQTYIEQIGFDRFLAGQFVNPLRQEATNALLYTNFPAEIIIDRIKRGRILHDPIIQYGLRSRFSYSWEDAYKYASRYGRDLMDEARIFEMNEGISVPMRRPGVPPGGVSLAARKIDFPKEMLAELELAAIHFYSKLESFHPPWDFKPLKPLSAQEIDVLQFAAAGKTYWETGKILRISESAVKDAMKRAREKLDAVDKTHAISTAIAFDLILP